MDAERLELEVELMAMSSLNVSDTCKEEHLRSPKNACQSPELLFDRSY